MALTPLYPQFVESDSFDPVNWRDRLGMMLGLIAPGETPDPETKAPDAPKPPPATDPETDTRVPLAISYAARAHHGQTRADGVTPYFAHPMRVASTLHRRFGVDDSDAYIAALLHDTIEDTKTTFDELAKAFGEPVARMVAVLTKDERLPAKKRDDIYYAGLETASWQTKAIKMADSYDNVLDSLSSKSPRKKLAAARRSLALAHEDHPELARARRHLAALIARFEPLIEPDKSN